MTDAQDAASEAGRELARARWGNQKAVLAAWTVIERVGELPDSLREQLHQATEAPDD